MRSPPVAPIIRLKLPGETPAAFARAAAKKFGTEFFVPWDEDINDVTVRIDVPFGLGNVGVRGEALAVPDIQDGKKGLRLRVVKLDPDSVQFPFGESETVEEFNHRAPTVAPTASKDDIAIVRATAENSARPAPKPQKKKPAVRSAGSNVLRRDTGKTARRAR